MYQLFTHYGDDETYDFSHVAYFTDKALAEQTLAAAQESDYDDGTLVWKLREVLAVTEPLSLLWCINVKDNEVMEYYAYAAASSGKEDIGPLAWNSEGRAFVYGVTADEAKARLKEVVALGQQVNRAMLMWLLDKRNRSDILSTIVYRENRGQRKASSIFSAPFIKDFAERNHEELGKHDLLAWGTLADKLLREILPPDEIQ